MSDFNVLMGKIYGQLGKNSLLENNFNFNVKLDSMKWKKVSHSASQEYSRLRLKASARQGRQEGGRNYHENGTIWKTRKERIHHPLTPLARDAEGAEKKVFPLAADPS